MEPPIVTRAEVGGIRKLVISDFPVDANVALFAGNCQVFGTLLLTPCQHGGHVLQEGLGRVEHYQHPQ